MSDSLPSPSHSAPSTADSGKLTATSSPSASDSGNSATPSSGAGAPLSAAPSSSSSDTPSFIGAFGQPIDPSTLRSFFNHIKPDLPGQVSDQLCRIFDDIVRIFDDIVNGKFGTEHLDWEIHLLELIQDYPVVVQRFLNLFGRDSGLEKIRARLVSNNNLPDYISFLKCLRDTIRQGFFFHEFKTLVRLVLHSHPDLWKEFENFPFERTNDATSDNKSSESSEAVPSSTKFASDKQNKADASPDDPVPASSNQVAVNASFSDSASKKQKAAHAYSPLKKQRTEE